MAASSASACSGERTLCAQLCTVVHAGAQRFGDAEHARAVAVLRRHELAQAVAHREIAELVDVGADERPEQAGPQMPVRVDEARHADHAAAVDDLRLRRIDLRPRPRRSRRRAHARRRSRDRRSWGPWSARWRRGSRTRRAAAASRRALCGSRGRRLREARPMRRSEQRAQRGRALEHRAPAHRLRASSSTSLTVSCSLARQHSADARRLASDGRSLAAPTPAISPWRAAPSPRPARRARPWRGRAP